jgi:hypothetical protein
MKLHTLTTINHKFLPKLEAYLISLLTHNFNSRATKLCKLHVPLKKNVPTKMHYSFFKCYIKCVNKLTVNHNKNVYFLRCGIPVVLVGYTMPDI